MRQLVYLTVSFTHKTAPQTSVLQTCALCFFGCSNHCINISIDIVKKYRIDLKDVKHMVQFFPQS